MKQTKNEVERKEKDLVDDKDVLLKITRAYDFDHHVLGLGHDIPDVGNNSMRHGYGLTVQPSSYICLWGQLPLDWKCTSIKHRDK